MMISRNLFVVLVVLISQLVLAFGLQQATTGIPVIDISKLVSVSNHDQTNEFCEEIKEVSEKINKAAQEVGFFYISNHGVSPDLVNNLVQLSKEFFELPPETKYQIAMSSGGKAWRGYFGVGDEVTSGIPDQKEGIYFGTELDNSDPRPMHGQNLWPEGDMGHQMKHLVLSYMAEMKNLGRLLMKAVSCSLGITEKHFLSQFDSPTELFRIFNYPPHNPTKFASNSLGVGEHTDYGYLTILRQDESGGLQVRSLTNSNTWISAPPIPNTFVINLGDALEHNTHGLYRATPHRVLQRVNATAGRISMPYFFDPSFGSEMKSMVPYFGSHVVLPTLETEKRIAARWDKLDPTLFQGTYGNYLLKKVSKAFPALFEQQIESTSSSTTTAIEEL
jgi:isopenicillin N synthase-like dioxygenase